MTKYFLRVNKFPYRPDDHIAFKVWREEPRNVGGVDIPYLVVEHFEQLAPGEESSVGYSNQIFEWNETGCEVNFTLEGQYTINQLTGIAEGIMQTNQTYSEQYEAFIHRIQELGFTRI
ncbi:hypothetical protein NST44_16090 [Paenibacillus sp. FSL W8-0919]|uniref:hypothetical protein n=1 Tax=Paenibacillus sp. FSL W8-0919 TaxID=2954707 RepID=UPI0030F54413